MTITNGPVTPAGHDDVSEEEQREARLRAALSKAATSEDAEVRRGVARGRLTSPEVLVALADDPHPRVREGVASNHATPASVAPRLARAPEIKVRASLAARRVALADEVVLLLARDTSKQVRRLVAERASVRTENQHWLVTPLPAQAFDVLAADGEPRVRKALALSEATSWARLCRVFADSDPDVRLAALGRLLDRGMSSPTRWIESWQSAQEYKVDPDRLAEVIDLAAGDASPKVRAKVAAVATLPLPLLTVLAADPAVEVRKVVAGHTRLVETDPEATRPLAADPEAAVRKVVADDAILTADLAAALCADSASSVRAAAVRRQNSPASAVVTAAGDTAPSVRAAAARSAKLPVAMLAVLAGDPEPTVRLAVAYRARVDVNLLARLAGDSDARVREVAAKSFLGALTDERS